MRPLRIAVTLTLLALLAGCKAADALSTREVIVHFAPGTSAADHLRVQQVCGVVPNVSPFPIPKQQKVVSQTDVHFLVKPGTDRNLARLYDCLGQQQFRSVVIGWDAPDM